MYPNNLNDAVNQQKYAGSSTGAQQAPDTLSTIFPRVAMLAQTVRRAAYNELCGLQGMGSDKAEGETPRRSGLVGLLQDIEDDLRIAADIQNEIRNILN